MIIPIVVILHCSQPIIQNDTKFWTEDDQQTYETAYNTCQTRYKKCLKIFRKKEELVYHAICGSERAIR